MRYVDPDGMWFGADDVVTGPIDEIIVLGLLTIFGAIKIYNSDENKNFAKALEESFENNVENIKGIFSKNSETSAAPSPLPPDPDDEENLEYESNPKHHQNARGNASQEPKNAKEMFEKSVKDPTKDGTRWYKDKNGNFHRFKEHHNGKYHWNGSTNTGTRLENVPIELRRNLPKGEF